MKTKLINLKTSRVKEKEGNQKLLTQKRNKTNKINWLINKIYNYRLINNKTKLLANRPIQAC